MVKTTFICITDSSCGLITLKYWNANRFYNKILNKYLKLNYGRLRFSHPSGFIIHSSVENANPDGLCNKDAVNSAFPG